MTAWRVRLSKAAVQDIVDIHRYVALSDCEANADRLMDALKEACRGLADLPERGNIPKELQAAGERDFRELHYKPYRILYRVGDGEVVILCVVDGRRDMRSFLQRRLLR